MYLGLPAAVRGGRLPAQLIGRRLGVRQTAEDCHPRVLRAFEPLRRPELVDHDGGGVAKDFSGRGRDLGQLPDRAEVGDGSEGRGEDAGGEGEDEGASRQRGGAAQGGRGRTARCAQVGRGQAIR